MRLIGLIQIMILPTLILSSIMYNKKLYVVTDIFILAFWLRFIWKEMKYKEGGIDENR